MISGYKILSSRNFYKKQLEIYCAGDRAFSIAHSLSSPPLFDPLPNFRILYSLSSPTLFTPTLLVFLLYYPIAKIIIKAQYVKVS